MDLIPSLRVAVWSACDLSCEYCHREGDVHPGRHLADRELLVLLRSALPLGLRKIKLTGGEPLLRPGLPGVVRELATLGIDLSLTTNGLELASRAGDLAAAGLRRINVSLDTLRPERFRELTGEDRLAQVLEGIRAAGRAGLALELDAVVLRGVNEEETGDLIAFAGGLGARIQFIELSQAGISSAYYRRRHRDLESLERWLRERGEALEDAPRRFDRPRFRVNGVAVSLCRFVRYSEPGVRRRGLRLAVDGRVYGFRYGEPPRADLGAALRGGAGQARLTELWERCARIGQEVSAAR